jgi:hypothetical protein
MPQNALQEEHVGVLRHPAEQPDHPVARSFGSDSPDNIRWFRGYHQQDVPTLTAGFRVFGFPYRRAENGSSLVNATNAPCFAFDR